MGTGLTPFGGEQRVNYSLTQPPIGNGVDGAQADPAVTVAPDEFWAVVFESPLDGTTDINLLVNIFEPDGNRPVLLNFVEGIDQTTDVTIHPAITATPDSLYVVAYSDVTAGTIDVRTFDAGGFVSSPFTVDGVINHLPNTHALDNAAIATFADGNILVAYEEVLSATDHNVDAAILNSTATGFVSPVNSIASSNAFEGESRVATIGNTGVLVFARDPGTIGGGRDIVLLFFNSTGTAIAAPTTVFGTSNSDVWSHPDVAALSDGRFIVVAQDDTTGGIAAAICDPATHAVTPVLNLSASTNPHVATLTDDGFVVTFESGGDVFEIRGGADGVFEQSGLVESFTTGTQDENAVAANPYAGGTLFFAWQDTGSGNPYSTDTDTRIQKQAFQLVSPPPPPAGTTAAMIMRDGNGDYQIYNLGNNAILGAGFLGQVGAEWQVAGVGSFETGDTADVLVRRGSDGAFRVLDVNNNQATGFAPMGQVGTEWTVSGFGNFSGNPNESDMLMRNSGTGAFELFDIGANQITGSHAIGGVGMEWSVAGFGNFSGTPNETDMLMRNTINGAFELFDISANQFTGFHAIGQVGMEWQVAGFGNFSSNPDETDMLMRNGGTGEFEVYDIGANQFTGFHELGQVGLEWTVAGFGDFSGNPNETDMLMRNSATGAFELYDIGNNQFTGFHAIGQVGPEWQVAGIANGNH